jgi:hypothetical protein
MKNSEVSEAAQKLLSCLSHLSKYDRHADLALTDLLPIIESAIDGTIALPMPNIPRGYDFHEGALRKYSYLEEAYSRFACLVKGYDV